MMNSKYTDDISIIIPAYNEEHRIVFTLKTLIGWCETRFSRFEIICVDDGSSDRTWTLIRDLEDIGILRCFRMDRNRGKGYAVAFGMRQAQGRFRFFTDADLPYSPEAFTASVEAFHADGCDMVTGARDMLQSEMGNQIGAARKISGRVFSSLANRLVRMDVADSQCGFKGFTADAAEAIFPALQTPGYAFDVEIFALARAFNLRVCRIPVQLVKQDGSKIRLAVDPFKMVLDLLKISWRMRKKGRSQRTEGRSQRTEGRGQRVEDSRPITHGSRLPSSETIIDAVLLMALTVFLMAYFDVRYLLHDTVVTGGDTASWLGVADHLANVLLPAGRLFGWDMGNFCGYPNFNFYFLPPFLLAVLPSKLLGIPLTIALKWAIMSGIFLMPWCAWAGLRNMRYRFPIPVMGAAAATVWMFNESWIMFGGNTLSTFAGEFCYMFAFAVFTLFIGTFYRGYKSNTRAVFNGILLGLIGLSHLFVFLPALIVMLYAWGDKARVGYLLKTGLTGFVCMAFWILPLLAYRHPYTTPVYMIWQEFVNLRYSMAGVLAIIIVILPGIVRLTGLRKPSKTDPFRWLCVGLCAGAICAGVYLGLEYLILGTDIWYTGLNVPDFSAAIIGPAAARELVNRVLPITAAVFSITVAIGAGGLYRDPNAFDKWCRIFSATCLWIICQAVVLGFYTIIVKTVGDGGLKTTLLSGKTMLLVVSGGTAAFAVTRRMFRKRAGIGQIADADAGRMCLWQALAAGCLVIYFAAHFLQIPDIRFLPPLTFSLLMLLVAEYPAPFICSAGGWVRTITGVAVCYLMIVMIIFGASKSYSWFRFNNRGYEGTSGYEEFAAVNNYLKTGYAESGLDPLNAPRVGYEKCDLYGPYGGDRAFESLPLFSGRQTLEGIHYAGAIASRCMAFIQTEFSRDIKSPNPQILSKINPAALPIHFDLYNLSQLVVMTDRVKSALAGSPWFENEARFGDISVFRYKGNNGRYVDVPAVRPVLYDGSRWADAFFEWFKHPEINDVLLVPDRFVKDPADRAVFSGKVHHLNNLDAFRLDAFRAQLLDRSGLDIQTRIDHLQIRFRTTKIGMPHLVKVSYFPNWKVRGANGVYPVSPHLMLVIPRQSEVVLTYARSLWEWIGMGITCGGLLILMGAGLMRPLKAIFAWRLGAGRVSAAAGRGAAEVERLNARFRPYLAGILIVCAIGLALSGALLRNKPVRTFIAGVHEYKTAEKYIDSGKMDTARSHWRKAILIMAPLLDQRTAYDHRDVINSLLYTAMCYERLDQPDQAEGWYRILVDEYPYSRYVAEAYVKSARLDFKRMKDSWYEGINAMENGNRSRGLDKIHDALAGMHKGLTAYERALKCDPFSVWAGYAREDLLKEKSVCRRYRNDFQKVCRDRKIEKRLDEMSLRLRKTAG
ncbi:MAG: glycosyltransferase [Desulfobacterales bacterium]|nr:glycosyltransferase [Desulfobacterales bacterium]